MRVSDDSSDRFVFYSLANKATGTIKAIAYGAFIFLIYVLLSLPFHLLILCSRKF